MVKDKQTCWFSPCQILVSLALVKSEKCHNKPLGMVRFVAVIMNGKPLKKKKKVGCSRPSVMLAGYLYKKNFTQLNSYKYFSLILLLWKVPQSNLICKTYSMIWHSNWHCVHSLIAIGAWKKCYFRHSTYCSKPLLICESLLADKRLCSLHYMLQCRLHLCWRGFLVWRVTGLWQRQRHMFMLKL